MTPHSAAVLNHPRTELWWAALGAGLVVILCVVILLSLLSAFVRDIDRHLDAAAQQSRGAAAHVSHAHLVDEAAQLIHDLGTELALQLAVLRSPSSAADRGVAP